MVAKIKECPKCNGTMCIESYPKDGSESIKKLVCMTCQYGEPYEEQRADRTTEY